MNHKPVPCPCGKTVGKQQLTYIACCGRYIDDFDSHPAPDAESLMRSRYTAYVLQQAPYLLATWETSQRPTELGFETNLKWLGLNIRAAKSTGPDQAEVEFVARSRLDGKGIRMHERSRFVRHDGRWFYVDGDMLS